MSRFATPLFQIQTGGPISSSPLLVDANDDGWPEVFVGGVRFHGFTWDGNRLPRWPRRAKRPFASSAAFGDINGDGRGELVIGCDDGRVYAYHLDGDLVKGWPFRAARDVFSTPALADLNSDGNLEVIVGSDDGSLYILNGEGGVEWTRALTGKPFISASPTVVDLDGDGVPEIVLGAWDGKMHAWTSEGDPFSVAWPNGRSYIWSSATAFRSEGGSTRLVWASDRIHAVEADGGSIRGWPRSTHSWMVSSPTLIEFDADNVGIIVGADRLYGWDLRGHTLPGWPADVGNYVWSSPIAVDLDGDGVREVIVGSWDHGVHAIRFDGRRVPGFPLHTGGPVFASAAVAPLPDGGGLLVVASWDGTVRGWRLPDAEFGQADWPQFRGSSLRTGVFPIPVRGATGTPPADDTPSGYPIVRGARTEPWYGGVRRVIVEGTDLHSARKLTVHYRIPGEPVAHPSPVMKSGDKFIALLQPLRAPKRLRYWVEIEREDHTIDRWPTQGFSTTLQLPSPLERLIHRLRSRWSRTGDRAAVE